MEQKNYPLLLGAVVLSAGCATPLVQVDSQNTRVAPVQRTDQPAGTAEGQYAVGRIQLSEGRYEAAAYRFALAVQLDPKMLDAYNALGVAHGLAGDYHKAVTAFDAALVVAPEAPHILNNLGFAQLKLGRLDEAWASLKRAFELDPRNAKTRENVQLLAQARRAAGQPDDAAKATLATAPAAVQPPASRPATPAVSAATPPTASKKQPPSYEVVMAASNDGSLVEIAPNLYEIRSTRIAVAPVRVAAAPTAPAASPAPIASAPVAVEAIPTSAPAAAPASIPAAEAAAAPAPALVSAPAPALTAPTTPTAPATPALVSAPAPTAPTTPALVSAPAPTAPTAPTVVTSTAPAAAAPDPEPPRLTATFTVAASAAGSAAPAPVVAPAAVAPAQVVATTVTAPRPVTLVRAETRPPRQPAKGPIAGLEISNGVGARNLAGNTARSFSRMGVAVARVSDYQTFGKSRTEIHYRYGHRESARALLARLPVGAKLVRSTRLHPGINVRLVIGQDIVGRVVAMGDRGVQVLDLTATSSALFTARLGIVPGSHASSAVRTDLERGWRYA